jgi:hypothetical protein
MPLWIRSHLSPPVHTTSPLDLGQVDRISIRPGNTLEVVSGYVPHGSWVLSNTTITSSGTVFTGPADPRYCGGGAGPETCLNWLGTLGLRQSLVYQPASHFWPLQWAETGISWPSPRRWSGSASGGPVACPNPARTVGVRCSAPTTAHHDRHPCAGGDRTWAATRPVCSIPPRGRAGRV